MLHSAGTAGALRAGDLTAPCTDLVVATGKATLTRDIGDQHNLALVLVKAHILAYMARYDE